MTKRVLIFGANGQVGTELQRVRWLDNLEILALARAQADITSESDIDKYVTTDTDLVINAAAYTAVDRAEDEIDQAFFVNRDGPLFLASACAAKDIPLIHISTDYVFDGTKDGAYTERDAVSPLGVYGESKEAGEQAVRRNLAKHIILRTTWVYASHGQNFVNTMLRLGLEREELGVVSDQFGAPTSAKSIASALCAIAERVLNESPDAEHELWGTYHFSDRGDVNWYEFAMEIFRQAGKRSGKAYARVNPIDSESYPTKAERPKNSRLNCSKIEKSFGLTRPSYEVALAEVMEKIVQLPDSA